MDITVNGVEISDAAIHTEMQHHPAPSPEIANYSARLALVAKELLLQEAARLGITGADEDARIAALFDREITAPELPDEASCQRFFQTHRQQFRSGDQYEVSHILCAAPPDDIEARAEARRRAESAVAQLAGDPVRFAELAAQLSDCPSKQDNGHLGLIGPGQTVPEFEQALFALQEGEISAQPVESRFGFHLIQLHRKTEGQTLEYEQVRDRITSYLRENGQRQAISRYLSLLTGRATIQGMDLPSANAPLAQSL
ncbi:MAG: peptidylprolyl isomerase [Candidatus Competibacteraceae bacterium]|nr:peptidylprolyl isomerase [Candidatus Competibacteraceae bacterium]